MRLSLSGTAEAEVITYPRSLLGVARSLIDNNHFDIAVVVAHMACEIATERSLSEAYAAKGLQYLEDAVDDLLNGYNLSNKRNRKLYAALTGDAIEKQPFWSNFCESATRRNQVVHKGKLMTKAEAEESYRAADSFVSHLKK